jgi:Zn-dependent protease
VATALGDRTAQRLGRLSLNPVVHLDPAGTFLMLLAGFGWGKPVPVDARALRGDPRTGMALVAAAGPLSNLVLATAFAIPIRLGWTPWHNPFIVINSTNGWAMEDYLGLFFSASVLFNCILAVFNLLPLAPLDGFRVAVGLLPLELARPVAQMERYGILILMGLFFLVPMLTGYNFFADVVLPPVEGIAQALTGI